MDNLSDYIPLIIIIGSIIYSVFKGTDKKRQEEMAKTILPGQKSGREVNQPEVFYDVKPVKKENKRKKLEEIPQPVVSPTKSKIRFESEKMIEAEYESAELSLNIEDVDEVKKAFIYSEIFNRREN
ncbi:MAG: hypothetical protein LBG15_09275 [Dysgonamonadaceae bacterium]|jgi:hypothetical protein|nr:hypothetical protein [Dysgonamonadaceae bacterium]